jgi:hypothetical protein
MRSIDFNTDRENGIEINTPARMHASRAFRQQQTDPAV